MAAANQAVMYAESLIAGADSAFVLLYISPRMPAYLSKNDGRDSISKLLISSMMNSLQNEIKYGTDLPTGSDSTQLATVARIRTETERFGRPVGMSHDLFLNIERNHVFEQRDQIRFVIRRVASGSQQHPLFSVTLHHQTVELNARDHLPAIFKKFCDEVRNLRQNPVLTNTKHINDQQAAQVLKAHETALEAAGFQLKKPNNSATLIDTAAKPSFQAINNEDLILEGDDNEEALADIEAATEMLATHLDAVNSNAV